MELSKDLRGSKNVIFSFMQNNDAWKLSTANGADDFYLKNLNELQKIQKQYSKIIGADYQFFNGNVVEYVKSKIPNLPELRLFMQYYELAKYLFMEELSQKYDKVLHIDIDIVPNTKKDIFDELKHQDSIYMSNIIPQFGINCPFYLEMEKYNKILKDNQYKYNGHVNHGVIGCTGYGARDFLKHHIDKFISFVEGIDPSFESGNIVFIGLEHYYMYILGTRDRSKLKFNLRYFEDGWNVYALADSIIIPRLYNKNHKAKFIHFCGTDAKNWFLKDIEEIRKLVKYKIGDYDEIK